MNCPCCGSADVHRSRRRGISETFKAWLNWWPYRCFSCEKRFFAEVRWIPKIMPAPPVQEAPQIAFQTHIEKPVAQVVVRAESQEQLDKMLLAMGRAIASFGAHDAKRAEKARVQR